MKVGFLNLVKGLDVLLLLIMMIGAVKLSIAQADAKLNLVVLAPAHPHGVQIQLAYKNQFARNVAVYGASEDEMRISYLNAVARDNKRSEENDQWQLDIYTGADFLDKMLADGKGEIAIIASNNQNKVDYIEKTVLAGMNVLADKPMALTGNDFKKLENAFSIAKINEVYVSDLPSMSMRRFVAYIIQKELRANQDVFGALIQGTVEEPAIVQRNHHYYWKGTTRPTWFFDIRQQGDGLTDVTTHLVDIVQWSGFDGDPIDYRNDISIRSARTWANEITPTQFQKATKIDGYPEFLRPYLRDSVLHVHANGEINYMLHGSHVHIVSTWGFESADGGGDWYESIMKGSKATLWIKPGNLTDLFIEPNTTDHAALEIALQQAFQELHKRYPYLSLTRQGTGWCISSEKRSVDREATLVTPSVIEQNNMLAKYYTTTTAHKMATRGEIK